MRNAILTLGLGIAMSAAAIGPQAAATPSDAKNGIVTNSRSTTIQLAQACGWYAIVYCGGRSDAQNFSNRTGFGYVVDTNDSAYPNFRAGYYCVVDGPMGRSAALDLAASSRSFAPTAYAKSAC
jgi:hypothetical protein